MLGAVGCLTPKLLAKCAIVPSAELVWLWASIEVLFKGNLGFFGTRNLVYAQIVFAGLVCKAIPMGTVATTM